MNRRAISCISILGMGALVLLSATAGLSEEDGGDAVETGAAAAPPVATRGYIMAEPAVAAPAAPIPIYPTTGCMPYPVTNTCSTAYYASSRPALARIDAQTGLMMQQTTLRLVKEIQAVQADAISPDGKKAQVATPVVQMRYVAESHETPFPFSFDVYKMEGTKLSEEEGRKAMKEVRAVVVASWPALMAEVMAPLGRQLYRDDVLVIVPRNDTPATVSPDPARPMAFGPYAATPPVTAPPALLPATQPVVSPAPPVSGPNGTGADAFPSFSPNGVPFKGNSFDSSGR